MNSFDFHRPQRRAVGRIAIIIVNYKSTGDCLRCVESILRHQLVDPKDIFLIDNCSPDDSFPRLQDALGSVINVSQSPKNGGFGYGINFGVQCVEAEYYLIINPDTFFLDNPLSVALPLFDRHHDLGILGLNLIYPDGSPQFSARTFYSYFTIALRRTKLGDLGIFRAVIEKHLMINAWSERFFLADWVMGTGFLVRRAAFEAIDGMDESYFLYMEDVDVCRRMWEAGWKVGATSEAKLVHDHRQASKKSLFSTAAKSHLASVRRYRTRFGIPMFGHGKRQ